MLNRKPKTPADPASAPRKQDDAERRIIAASARTNVDIARDEGRLWTDEDAATRLADIANAAGGKPQMITLPDGRVLEVRLVEQRPRLTGEEFVRLSQQDPIDFDFDTGRFFDDEEGSAVS
jgi:hypothetical protein